MACEMQSFFNYINQRGIEEVKSFTTFRKSKKEESQMNILSQLKTLSSFHKRSMGYDGYVVNKLDNDIGKIVESYKVAVRRLKRDLDNIGEKKLEDLNEVELILKNKGDEYLKRCNHVIEVIEKNSYYDLILRSMKNHEVCIYKNAMDNLRSVYVVADFTLSNQYNNFNNYFYKYFGGDYLEFLDKESRNNLEEKEIIQVVNLDRCAYNLVEVDCFYLLNNLRKKNNDLDYKFFVQAFCSFEGLGKESERFILALLSYPLDFMRWVERYREHKKDWTVEKYAEKLKRVMEKEIKLLV